MERQIVVVIRLRAGLGGANPGKVDILHDGRMLLQGETVPRTFSARELEAISEISNTIARANEGLHEPAHNRRAGDAAKKPKISGENGPAPVDRRPDPPEAPPEPPEDRSGYVAPCA